MLSFEKALIYSDKRVRDLSYNLPPLSKVASEHSREAADNDDARVDVDPTSASIISAPEASQILPLVIQMVEFDVSALDDLKEVLVTLKKLQAALSPDNIWGVLRCRFKTFYLSV